jgi:peptide/nickel transport system substrate-binding protein
MSGRRSSSWSRSLVTALAATAILVVAGCGSSPASPSPSPIPTATPVPSPTDSTPRGGTATYAAAGDVPTWDPCYTPAGATVSEALSAVYGNLMWTDMSGVVQPGMAASLSTTDAATWTLKVRAGLRFSDGTAFDANAVKYNWDRAADPANGCTQQRWIASWTSLATTDALTLVVKLPKADSSFPAKVAELIPFVGSPTALMAASNRANLRPVGAGPFMLATWRQGDRATFDRNPGYWDQPRPYLDHLVIKAIPDSSARMAAVLGGTADYMVGYLAQYGTNATKAGMATHTIAALGLDILWFNTRTGITGLMSDVRARQAVVTGVAATSLAAALTGDAKTPVPDSLYPAPSPLHDTANLYPAYDKAKAQSLIDAVVKDGKKFEFTIVAPSGSDTLRAGTYLQQAMNAYKGVTASLSVVPLATWLDICGTQGKMDVCVAPGIQVFNGPELSTFSYLYSSGANNLSRLSDGELDAALDSALAAVSESDRVAAYRKVQAVYLRDLPFWAFAAEQRTMLTADTLGGIVNFSQAGTLVDRLYRCPASCA